MYLTPGDRVFAVVLNYESADDTFRCVSALRRSLHLNLFIVVVDNGSSEEQQAMLRSSLGPTMTILATGENLGYAGGNNVGIAYSLERDADFVWLLNPDAEPAPDALTGMLEVARSSAAIGVVGGVNVSGDRSAPTVQMAGGTVDWASGVPSLMNVGDALDVLPTDPYEVDYVAGNSLLIRRSLMEDIGVLPEEYFLYFEETEYMALAKKAGWRVVVNPRSLVWHHHRSRSELPQPYYVYYYIRARLLFAEKFGIGTPDRRLDGLRPFIDGWRERVTERAPWWLDTFDMLVDNAIEDGLAGVTGRRDDIASIPGPKETQG